MRAVSAVIALMAMSVAHAGEWEGKTMTLTAAEQISRHVPIEMPFPWTLAEGERIAVMQPTTAREFPAQVRDGILSFVYEGAIPGAEHLYVLVAGPEGKAPRVEVTKSEDADALVVSIDDQHFTTYHYARERDGALVKKPYLWPILAGVYGVPVTREYPMEPAANEADEDHPHHRSFWTSHGNINGADLWSEGENSGVQHSGTVTFGSGDAYGWILAENEWRDKDGNPVIDETREYRFYAGPAGVRLFDLKVTFTATHGDAVFHDTKEGGIAAMRVAYTMRADQGGTMLTSEGVKVDKTTPERLIWGLPATWLAYYGPVADKGVHGIAILDHPSNPRHPTRWHARKYGLVGANIFGLSDFTNGEENGDLTVAAGEALSFNYRMVVHEGGPTIADIPARFADYASPPQVVWSE